MIRTMSVHKCALYLISILGYISAKLGELWDQDLVIIEGKHLLKINLIIFDKKLSYPKNYLNLEQSYKNTFFIQFPKKKNQIILLNYLRVNKKMKLKYTKYGAKMAKNIIKHKKKPSDLKQNVNGGADSAAGNRSLETSQASVNLTL